MSGMQVRSWALSMLGTRAGAGEGFDLVDQALRATGHRSAADFGDVTAMANHVWGVPITLGSLAAGDVVQFLAYRIDVHADWSDGTTFDGHEERTRHSAIVDSVGPGGEVFLLEQDVPPGRPVRRCRLFLTAGEFAAAVSANLGAISDVPPPGSPTARLTVVLSGSLWYYRAVECS